MGSRTAARLEGWKGGGWTNNLGVLSGHLFLQCFFLMFYKLLSQGVLASRAHAKHVADTGCVGPQVKWGGRLSERRVFFSWPWVSRCGSQKGPLGLVTLLFTTGLFGGRPYAKGFAFVVSFSFHKSPVW